jgi:hypothetical protein
MKALKNEKEFLPNVMCPFGSSEYCFKDNHVAWDLVIQRLLLKVLLPHIDKTCYLHVQHMWDQFDREDDDFDSILLNRGWEIRPAIVISESGCPRVVTCRNHRDGSKFQVLYPPRYPEHHLSAKCTNQLCPIAVQPRIARTTCAKEFCTTLGMSHQYSHFLASIHEMLVSMVIAVSLPNFSVVTSPLLWLVVLIYILCCHVRLSRTRFFKNLHHR